MTTVAQQLGICSRCGEKFEPMVWPNGIHGCRAHTPGPWTNPSESVSVMAGKRKVCDTSWTAGAGMNLPEAKANAALIAAAPTMLRALLFSWEHYDDNGRTFHCNCPAFKKLVDDSSDDNDNRHSSACLEGRKAITKATPALTEATA